MHKMRVLLAILLSLLIHFFLAWSLEHASLQAVRPSSQAVTVELVEQNESQNETEKDKQIVRDAEAPEKEKREQSDDPLVFFSARDQRVQKQTQAPNSGLTRNRSNEPAPEEEAIRPEELAESRKPKEDSSDDGLNPRSPKKLESFLPKYRKTPLVPQQMDLEKGLSTVGEALPQDVAVGSFTSLNTDRYLYYSFFSRIEELIRFRWENLVRSTIDMTPPERFASNIQGVWTTHMEILIKPNGELHSTRVMKEAGHRGFDQAAVQAFVQARLFPNPPEEMVESDGLIHLKYSFQVHYEPKVVVRSSP